MTAPIPHGLFNVTSTVKVEPKFSHPADIVFERLQTLRSFWKVHNAQSRVSRDPVSIRSGQLFWRVWGDPRLSIELRQSTLIELWIKCQRDFDLAPFDLQLPSTWNESKSTTQSLSTSQTSVYRSTPDRYERSQSPFSVSPTDLTSAERSLEDIKEHRDGSPTDPPDSSPVPNTTGQPTPIRTLSNGGSGGNKKRTSFHAATTRGRTRPSMVRKRSSQTQPMQDSTKTRSALKSPRSSTEVVESGIGRKSVRTPSSQIPTNIDATNRTSRTISDLALPSASSWQSDDIQLGNRPKDADSKTALAIDRNFREKFVEHQKQLNSSTDLAGMNRLMRKTGSVVRFADQVDISDALPPSSSQIQKKPDGAPQSLRQNLQRHDSIGSVAAVSDGGSEDEEADEDNLTMLPRVRSQLSLGIADLKRSQSMIERGTDFAVTSPEIEVQQEALINGKNVKSLTEDEEKLLAMGRRDGVTRAGGVNLPKELTVRGAFEISDDSDSSDQPLY